MRAWRRGRRDCSVRGFDDLAAVALLLLLLLVCCSSRAPYFLWGHVTSRGGARLSVWCVYGRHVRQPDRFSRSMNVKALCAPRCILFSTPQPDSPTLGS